MSLGLPIATGHEEEEGEDDRARECALPAVTVQTPHLSCSRKVSRAVFMPKRTNELIWHPMVGLVGGCVHPPETYSADPSGGALVAECSLERGLLRLDEKAQMRILHHAEPVSVT